MSENLDLGAALEAAQARASSPTKPSSARISTDTARMILRDLAVAHGLKPDAVVASFDEGGMLADLLRALIGAEAERRLKLGPPVQDETLRSFMRVAELKATGLSQGRAVVIHADEVGLDPQTVKARYKRWRGRKGVIGAAFFLPMK